MSTGNKVGVAISTTGDEHRLDLLTRSVAAWRKAIGLGSVLVVTVDGDAEAFARAAEAVDLAEGSGGVVLRVGQPLLGPDTVYGDPYPQPRDGRLGVAVNKNTGIEWLMDAGVDHLFLSDDDTWPLYPQSLEKHIDFGARHSMVCWGKNRLEFTLGDGAAWTWPRGVMLYVRRPLVDVVGGMDERFGPGGHEHVEWSQRIHRAGLTSFPFISPLVYALNGPAGPGTRAASLWHCEDMRRPGEPYATAMHRKKATTSVRRRDGDWAKIEALMAERAQDPNLFVPYTAHENGRTSATLYVSTKRSEEA